MIDPHGLKGKSSALSTYSYCNLGNSEEILKFPICFGIAKTMIGNEFIDHFRGFYPQILRLGLEH
jgi:hypothetical protein